jgi:hypothetical protein
MNWSAGFQFQVAPAWLATATYRGTAGLGLVRSWNINQIPLSIGLGDDRALQDKVFAAQQNYLLTRSSAASTYYLTSITIRGTRSGVSDRLHALHAEGGAKLQGAEGLSRGRLKAFWPRPLGVKISLLWISPNVNPKS